MKNLIFILISLICLPSLAQQVLQRTNTATLTNKSWQVYRQNSPTNVYGNSFVSLEVNFDSIYLHNPFIKIDILDNRKGITPAKKFVSANANGILTQGSFDSLFFGINQITGLSTSLNDRPTYTEGSLIYKPLSYSPSYTDVVNGLGYVPAINYNAGLGIKIAGQIISVDTSVTSAGNNAIMYMGKANTAINNLQNGINGKQNQLNGTGFVKISGTTISYDNSIYQPALTAGTGISIVGNVISNTSTPQVVNLSAGNRIQITGTYPNLTISYIEPTINTVSRSANTNYTISSTKQATVFYSVTCQVTNPLLIGTSTATAFLEYSTNAGTSWQTASQVSNSSGVGVAVAIQLTNSQTGSLAGVIPANALVRIRTSVSGTASVTIISAVGQEIY